VSESVQHAACPDRSIGVGLWGPKSDPAAREKKIEELLATAGRALGAFWRGPGDALQGGLLVRYLHSLVWRLLRHGACR
jgi:hypothetical protein